MLFILIVIITLYLTWKYGDWRHWDNYQASMMLFPLGNLLVLFVYHDHFLWKLTPNVFNHHIMEILLSFTVFPWTVLLFLSDYPKDMKRLVLRILRYVLIYIIIEFILYKTGKMVYAYGWNIWWSSLMDILIFPILALHYKKPLIADIICVISFFIMGMAFPFAL